VLMRPMGRRRRAGRSNGQRRALPGAVGSRQVYAYFKQMFAQVTNPAIDPRSARSW